MSIDIYNQDRQWNEIKIGNSVYMFSVTKNDGVFNVSLTNLIELWVELLTADAIKKKCQELNKLLNVNSLNCIDIVSNILNNIPDHIVQATVQEIQLRTKIENNPFKFSLNLRKASPDEFWNVITKPLCLSSLEILRQHKILLDTVKKKDAEIAEYKAEGAELIRKNIETKPFEDSQLKTSLSLRTVDSVSAFCKMVNIYNTLELRDTEMESASTSKSVINIKGSKSIASSQSLKTQAKLSKLKKKSPRKSNTSKPLFTNSEKYMNIVPARTKTKKSLDFI